MLLLSVEEAARVIGVTTRTVRRWLQAEQLAGRKIGATWVVLVPAYLAASIRSEESLLQQVGPPPSIVMRQRLRCLGHRLIDFGNAQARVRRKRGDVFLTWRRPGSLQIVFAIGRQSPTQGWSPHALGIELPFWLKARHQWRSVRPLLRRYERLRLWCHPRLLCIPRVQEVISAEINGLRAAMETREAQDD
jgi:excisionase family DNA binding protein